MTITAGPDAGQTKTYRVDSNGTQISATIKNADGSGLNSVNDKSGNTTTYTDKSGEVTTEKRDIAGTLVSKTIQSTVGGQVTTQTIDPTTGKIALADGQEPKWPCGDYNKKHRHRLAGPQNDRAPEWKG